MRSRLGPGMAHGGTGTTGPPMSGSPTRKLKLTQISSQIALHLGDTTRRIRISQLGRFLAIWGQEPMGRKAGKPAKRLQQMKKRRNVNNNFNLWTASPNFVAQIQISREGEIIPSYHGRQTPGQVQFCSCHTWCDTTQTLTRRFFQGTASHTLTCQSGGHMVWEPSGRTSSLRSSWTHQRGSPQNHEK